MPLNTAPLVTCSVPFSDAIKEADGERVLRCWRYLLLIYGSWRTNYSIEALNLLCQHQFYLTPRKSSELILSVAADCMEEIYHLICTKSI